MAKNSSGLSQAKDGWDLWSKVYSDRDMRLKLYCRDPALKTPSVSNILVVTNVHKRCTMRHIVSLFEKYGTISDTKIIEFSDNGYYSCLITFEFVKNAILACNSCNGLKLDGWLLNVSHLDYSDKYFKAEEVVNAAINSSAEENVVGYVRQAQLQSECRASKCRSKRSLFDLTATNSSNSGGKSVGSLGDSMECWDDLPTVNDQATFVGGQDENNEQTLQEEKNPSLKRIKCIDDVMLDSEACFWDWLYAKLIFSGPLLYSHKDIRRALRKLPLAECRNFEWFLQSINSSDDFTVFECYVCLHEHLYWAKEMFFISNLEIHMNRRVLL